MTTSGTISFSRNRDQIIGDALLLAGVIDENETPSSNMVNKANANLNAMVKHWQGTGTYIWAMAEAALFLQPSQVRYVLGSGTSDHCTESFVQTTLSAAAASGATSLSVTAITGMASADYLGVQLDDGSFQWTTINGAPSGTTVVPTAALTGAAASGNVVITYTTNIARPLKVVSARRFNFVSGIDTPLMIDSREEYFDLPLKTGPGVPNIVFYDRRGGANSTGAFYTWQREATVTDCIKFTWQRPIQDFNVAADDPDLPQEWIQTIVFNLAEILALSYGHVKRLELIEPRAARYLGAMMWNEKELEDISFYPDLRNMRR